MKKLFIIQKLVMAESIDEALRIERKTAPLSVFIDDEFKKIHLTDKNLYHAHPKKK